MDCWKQMGRAKVPIRWIPRDSSSNMKFIKRKKGLKKKVEELSILCGVEACMVCFDPQMDQQTASDHPDVWPGRSNVLEIVERYRNLSKEDQEKKKLDNSSFLEQRVKKLKVELSIKRKESRLLEMEAVYPSDKYLNLLTIEQLIDLVNYIDIRLESVQERIEFLSRHEHDISNGTESDNVMLMELECTTRQSMEGGVGGPYKSMMPYQSGDESLNSAVGHVKPYPSLEGEELMSSSGTAAMDYYSKDYHAPHSKEAMANGEDDRMAASNAHLMVNTSFPLLGIESLNHIQSSTQSCSHWSCSIKPCPLHNPLYSACPQHHGMNPTIQQLPFSCEPQHQQWFNGTMQSQIIQVLGDEYTDFANNNSVGAPPLMLNRLLGTNDHCHIKNIQDFETFKKQKS